MVTARPNPRAQQLAGVGMPKARPAPRSYRRPPSAEDQALMEEVGAQLNHCGAHAIDYYVFEGERDACPACALQDRITGYEIEVQRMRNAVQTLQTENQRLTRSVNVIAGLRVAVDLLSLEELAWLKGYMYQWRTDRSVKLKAVHDTTHEHPTGIMAVPKKGDPDALTCTSIGGLALAGSIKEASEALGIEDMMSALARAMHNHLKGGLE